MTPSRRADAAPDAGFTLFEVIIAVVVSGLLLAGLTTVFLTGTTGTTSAAQRARVANDAQTITAFLVRDAQAAGGVSPTTGLQDTGLGVVSPDTSTTTAVSVKSAMTTAGCALPDSSLVVVLAWIDRSGAKPIMNFATYKRTASSNKLVRTLCVYDMNPSTPSTTSSDVTLAEYVTAATVACTTAPCTTLMPDAVAMTVTESNTPKISPTAYTFTITASLRPSFNATDDTPSGSNSGAAPLMALGGGCQASNTPGVKLTGDPEVRVYGDAVVNTTDKSPSCTAMQVSNSSFFVAGNTLLLSGGTCAASGASVCPQPQSAFSPAMSDPFAGLTPPSTTGMTARTNTCNSSGAGMMQPGVYAANVHIASNTQCTFVAGIYVFQDGLSITNGAGIDASAGVLFYVPDKAGSSNDYFNFSGGSAVTITAPTAATCVSIPATCPYVGLAVWQASTQPTITIANGANFTINGTVYGPNATADFSGGTVTPRITALIVKSLLATNGAGVNLGPSPSALAIGAATMPQWTKSQPNYPGPTMTGTGGFGTYTWSMSNGNGLTINATTGAISGTPTSASTYNVTVTLNDSFGDTAATRAFSVTINAAPSITTASLPGAAKNASYNQTLAKTGGTAPFNWSISAGSLPAGLSLNATTGVITGTATTVATSSFTVTLSDAAGATATKALSITIGSPPTITSISPTSRGQGAVNQSIAVTGTNFQLGAQVSFSGSGITVNSTTWNSATSLTAFVTIAGNATTGTRDISETNADGGTFTLNNAFTVNAAPTMSLPIAPNVIGQGATRTGVVINGSGFSGTISVLFSGTGVTASAVTVTATKLTFNVTATAGAANGARDVTIVNGDGGRVTAIGAFTVNAAPTIASILPASRARNTNGNHTITGTGFQTSATVTISGSRVTVGTVTVVNGNTITVALTVANNAATGVRDVTVTNADGGTVTLTGGFTVS